MEESNSTRFRKSFIEEIAFVFMFGKERDQTGGLVSVNNVCKGMEA